MTLPLRIAPQLLFGLVPAGRVGIEGAQREVRQEGVGAADEAVALLGVAGDAVEEGAEELGRLQALRVDGLVDEQLVHDELVDGYSGYPLEQRLEPPVEIGRRRRARAESRRRR